MRLFCKSQRLIGVVVVWLPRSWFTVPSLHAGRQSSPLSPPDKERNPTPGSRLRCKRVQQHHDHTCIRHVFPATAIGSWAHAANPLNPASYPRWHRSATRAWLTGRLFVFLSKMKSISCASFVLDLRLKKEISLLKCCVYIVWVLWGKAQSRHTVGGL